MTSADTGSVRSFITIDPILKRLGRILPLWFVLPAVLSCGWSILLSMLALGPGDPFEYRGVHWIWIKACFNGLVGLAIGFAVNRRGAARIASLLVAVALVALDHTRAGTGWATTLVNRGIENIGYHIAMRHPFIPRDVPFTGNLRTALPPRTQIDVVTPIGPLRITTGHGSLRTYSWNGATRSLQLFPPGGSEDAGGDAYYPDNTTFHTRRSIGFKRFPTHDWVAHQGISRGEEWESEIAFDTRKQAETWLRRRQNKTLLYVWTHDGLVVGWSTGVDYKALTVEVWQVLIRGEKPSQLAGSRDDKIQIRSI